MKAKNTPGKAKSLAPATTCPEAVASLRLDAPGWLEASAGSGKTYAIEHLVLRLIKEAAIPSLSHVLLVTFTEKAAGELKEKLRRRIETELESGELPPSARARLREAHERFDKASVHTIHGFCLQALRRYAFELGGLFEAQLADEEQLIEQAWLALRREAAPGHNRPSAEREAVLYCSQPPHAGRLLKLAKAYRPERGDTLDPEPTEAAASEREAQVLAEIELAAENLKSWINPNNLGNPQDTDGYKAFEAFAKGRQDKVDFKAKTKALKELHRLLWPQPAGQRLNVEDGVKLVTKRTTKWGKEGAALFRIDPQHQPSPDFAAFRLEAELRMARFIDGLESLKALRAQEPAQQLGLALKTLSRKCLALKSEAGLMTYEDMAWNLWQALQRSEALVALLRRQFPVAIVDEFQDTDPVQWAIFEKLYLAEDKPRPLYLVGDPKQAIYGFRGGDLATYLRARMQIQALSLKGQALGLGLDANFRSRENLLAAMNAVFAAEGWFATETSALRIGDWRLPAKADDITFTPARFGGSPTQQCEDRTALPQPVVLLPLPAPPPGKSAQQRDFLREHLDKALARHIADLLRQPHRLLVPASGDSLRPLHAGDLCVLVRNHAERLGIEVWMRKLGIPYHVHKQRGLFRSPEAAHLAVVLKALAHPIDLDAQWAAHLSELLPAPLAMEEGKTVTPQQIQPVMHPLLQRLWPLAVQGKWPLLFRRLRVEGGLQARLSRKRARHGAEAGSWARYLHLMQRLGKDALTMGLDIMGLHERLVRLRRSDEGQEDMDGNGAGESEGDALRASDAEPKVTVLTMHASKGLEFPVVFLAGGLSAPRMQTTKTRHREGLGFTWHLPNAAAETVLETTGDSASEANPEENAEANSETTADTTSESLAGAGDEDALKEALRRETLDEDKRLLYVALTRAQYKLYLPLAPVVPARGQVLPAPFMGFARAALLSALHDHPEFFAVDPEVSRDFDQDIGSKVEIDETRPVEASKEDEEDLAATLGSLGPRRRRLASYTQLARRRKQLLLDEGGKRLEPDEIEAEDITSTETPALNTVASAALPPGSNTGNFLHACLEQIHFAHAAEAETPEAFAQGPAGQILTRELKAHRLDPECLPEAALLIHSTLTATLNDPAGGADFRLCDVSECLPELEFMLPYGIGANLNAGNVTGMESRPALPDVRRAQGYLWGYIDLVFRHGGRFYLLDWKSNTLADYRPGAVAASMRAEAYDLQGRLYALALHRWLAHRLPDYAPELHFGGVFYLYLRGLRDAATAPQDSPGRGVHAWQPTPRDLEQGYIEYLAEYLEVAPEVLAAAIPATEKDR